MTKIHFTKAFGFVTVLVLSSCSNLSTKLTTATISPSEITADGTSRLDVMSSPSQNYTSTSDASARPPTFTASSYSERILTGTFVHTFWNRVQFGLGLNSDFAILGTIQFQLLGEPNKEGFNSTLGVSSDFSSFSKSGNQKGTFGPGGYPWKASISQNTTSAQFAMGYRLNPNVLPFIGYSQNSHSIKSKIDQSVSTDNSDQGGSYEKSESASSKAAGLGLKLTSGNIHFTPIIQWTKFETSLASTEGVQAVFVFSIN